MLHERIFIALGGNVGPVAQTFSRVVHAINGWPSCAVLATSRIYRTKPVDAEGGDFLNAVIDVRSDLEPTALLDALLDLEKRLGRDRPHSPPKQATETTAAAATLNHQARPIDLDLLIYGSRVVQTPRLTIPHPRMNRRAFVLAPLADVAPDWLLGDGLRVDEALARCADRDDVKPIDG